MVDVVKDVTREQLRGVIGVMEGVETAQLYAGTARIQREANNMVSLNWDSRNHLMTAESFIRLGKVIGIPDKYTSKVPVSLMLPHYEYWLREKPEQQISIGLNDKSQIMHVYKGNRTPVPTLRCLDVLEERLGTELDYHHVSFDPDFTRFSVTLGETAERAVRVGDPVRFGLTVTNSMTFKRPLEVAAYTHRLVCTNGSVSDDHIYRYRANGDEDEQRYWLERAIDDAIEAANSEFERLDRMDTIELHGHVSEYLELALAEFGVPSNWRDDVRQSVVSRQPRTLYDLYNVVTDMASNSTSALQDAEASARLMRSAGRMAVHLDICDNCGKPR